MHRRPLVTILRSLLLSLFVLGGPGLPLIDAVVWHGSGSQQLAGSRLDEPGAPRLHADVCSLAAPLPVPGPVPCSAPPVLDVPVAGRAPADLPQSVRATVAPDRSARPRAPPVIFA
jgi:hypothetical protein